MLLSSTNPDLVSDGQTFSSIANNTFNRWRCDPTYNSENFRKQRNCKVMGTHSHSRMIKSWITISSSENDLNVCL